MTNNTHPTPETAETTMEEELVAPELAALLKERDEWKEKAYRLAAEMENSKHRNETEMENARRFALQGFARDLLPVADNMTRALQTAEGNEQGLREGVQLVAKTLEETLTRHGISKVSTAAGQPLNPEHHQAMTEVPSDHPKGHIVEEMQEGYLLQGRLLRPAMVSVSSGPLQEGQ